MIGGGVRRLVQLEALGPGEIIRLIAVQRGIGEDAAAALYVRLAPQRAAARREEQLAAERRARAGYPEYRPRADFTGVPRR